MGLQDHMVALFLFYFFLTRSHSLFPRTTRHWHQPYPTCLCQVMRYSACRTLHWIAFGGSSFQGLEEHFFIVNYTQICQVISKFWWKVYNFFFNLYWRLIASQYCVSFCCTTERISHIHTHAPILLPSWASLPSSLSHPSRSSQSTEPISLCYAAASHHPTIGHSVVYICQCYSHFAPASPPTPCPQVHSLCLHLYSCPATRPISQSCISYE